jgi:RNA polymerase sigma-70 factor (ECF subfamily)
MDNESQIIESIKNGNLNDFSLLYDAYLDKIYRYIFFKTRQKETAEDITSDVFIKALSKIRTFDSSKASFSVWIYRIARNSVIDHYRSRKETVNIEDAWDLASDDNVEKDVQTNLSLKQVEEYIKKLKPEQRDLVVLRVWQDLSYKEISEIMGKDENNLRVSFGRIVSTMKKELGVGALLLLISLGGGKIV